MLKLMFPLGLAIFGHVIPISDAISGAQDQEMFAKNFLTDFLDCTASETFILIFVGHLY